MKKYIPIFLFVVCGVPGYAQGNSTDDAEIKLRFKELSAKVQNLLNGGQKYAAFAYMDSIDALFCNGSSRHLLYVSKNEGTISSVDKESSILGAFEKQLRMFRVERYKVLPPNVKIYERKK